MIRVQLFVKKVAFMNYKPDICVSVSYVNIHRISHNIKAKIIPK
jgi:hypothetical protein